MWTSALTLVGVCLAAQWPTQASAIDAAATQTIAQEPLTEIEVTALRITNEATKLGVETRDLPQVVTTLDAATFQSNAVTTLDDLGHLSALIQPVQPYAGVISGGWNSRGYNASFVLDGLSVGNIGGGSSATFVPDLLSSAEILNGPTAIVFGQGSPGGLVNLVSNKPQADFGWMTKAVVTTENQKLLTADFTGNIAPNIDGRILIQGERSDSFRDYVHSQRDYIAPQIHWQITDQLSWRLLYIYDDYSYTFDPGYFYTPALFGQHLPTSLYFGEPYLGLSEAPESIYRSDLEFDFNEHWSAYVLTQYFKQGTTGLSDRIYPNGVTPGQTVIERIEDYDVIPALNYNEDFNLEAYVRGAFSTGPIGHQVTVDVAYQRGRQSYYNDAGTIPAFDYANPVYSSVPYTPVFQYNSQGSTSVGSHSVAAEDLLSLGEHFKVMLGLRHDNVFDRNYDAPNFVALDPDPADQLTQGHLSKQGGVIYRPIDALSVYVSYADAFQPNLGLNADHSAFQPVKSINREIGVKAELFNRKLSVTGAVYRIAQDNTLVVDPTNPNFEVNGGDSESKGFDLQTNLTFSPDAHAAFGLAHTVTEYLRSDYIPYGDHFPGVPAWTALLSGDYRVSHGTFTGLRGFVNANYNTSAQSYLPNSGGAPIPRYVRLDLGGSYVIKNMLVQLNLKNALNQRIILSNGYNNEIPEASRTLWLTLSWRGGSLKPP